MHRKTVRPFGQSTSMMRLASMLMALLVIGALYFRLKDPAIWRLFVDESAQTSVVADGDQPDPEPEQVVPGPNDLDESEVGVMAELFELINDRAPLKSREMDAYWRLMDWSRTQPFDELEKRAKTDVAFTQLWEQPDLYRGRPIRLRLHVRRVLVFDAPENSSHIEKVCEAWGWTDESRSFPYVVVFPGPLEGLPVGTDVRAEIVFAGYFMKIMSYTAFDHSRGAPLLVGRARLITKPATAAPSVLNTWSLLFMAILLAAVVFIAIRSGKRPVRVSTVKNLPDELLSFGQIASDPPASGDDQEKTDRDSPVGFHFTFDGEFRPPSS